MAMKPQPKPAKMGSKAAKPMPARPMAKPGMGKPKPGVKLPMPAKAKKK